MAEPLVPNPRHVVLRELLTRARDQAARVRTAYHAPVADMYSHQVWTGPTARKWTHDLEFRHHRLTRLAEQVVNALEEELGRHPSQVTAAEANNIRREMAGRIP
ncbi:hypothetical protein [Nonomuraea fuscirosea]|uniref:hypothetical protein n=1 Tax=Nonomuraea fuscirosea TaxID=1291556 RepID=UPI0033DD3F74